MKFIEFRVDSASLIIHGSDSRYTHFAGICAWGVAAHVGICLRRQHASSSSDAPSYENHFQIFESPPIMHTRLESFRDGRPCIIYPELSGRLFFMSKAKDWFVSKISSHLFTKLSLLFVLVSVITAIAFVFFVNITVARSLEREVSDRLAETMDSVVSVSERLVRKVEQLVIQFHYLSDSSDSVASVFDRLTSPGASLSGVQSDRKFVQDLMDVAVYNNQYLLDIILIDRTGHARFHATNRQARNIVSNFDFSEFAAISLPRRDNGGVGVFYDHEPQYLIRDREPVITFAAAMLRPTAFPSAIRTGTVLMNGAASSFMDAYLEMGGAESGGLIVGDDSGRVLFSSLPEFRDAGTSEAPVLPDHDAYFVSTRTHPRTGLTFTGVSDKRIVYRGLREVRNRSVLFFSIATALIVTITISVSHAFSRRIGVLVDLMARVESGDLGSRVAATEPDELGYLARSFNRMCERLGDYIDREFRSRLRVQEAEFAELQQRINPHFLFNTLEVIRSRSERYGQTDVSEMIARLGQLFRWNLRHARGAVTLEEELDYVEVYSSIVRMGSDHVIDLQIAASDEALAVSIPRLILQPIVENGIVHGKEGPDGDLVIRIRSSRGPSDLEITVEDNGVGIAPARLSEIRRELSTASIDGNPAALATSTRSIGLKNVQDRIRMLYGAAYGLSIDSRPGCGTMVTVRLPLPATGREERR